MKSAIFSLCCLLTVISIGVAQTALPYCKPPLIASNSHLTIYGTSAGIRRNSRSSSGSSSSNRVSVVRRQPLLYKIGTILRLRCKNGYQLQGQRHLICLYKSNNAYWSSTKLPICIKSKKYMYTFM